MRYGYVIGRFQPFHNGHRALVEQAMANSDRVIIVIGSTGCAPDYRNPWYFEEVRDMIKATFPAMGLKIVKVEDSPYDDTKWVSDVRFAVGHCDPADTHTLFGFHKDSSSYYLDLFPEWQFQEYIGTPMAIDATKIRERFFRMWNSNIKKLPDPVREQLQGMSCGRRSRICDEAVAIFNHDLDWGSEGGRKYGVQHVAADVLMHTDDRVALIVRGGSVGHSSIAMPGGHVNKGERIIDAALRELREETGVVLDRRDFPQVGATTCYDYPQRDLRGHFFTNVLTVKVPEEYPLRAADDAHDAKWIRKADLPSLKPAFFSDHYHIVTNELRKAQ